MQDMQALSSVIKHNLKDKSKTAPADPLMGEKIENARADRGLKKSYARWFIGILIFQLVMMNVVFILVGCKLIEFNEWTLNLYMAGTLAEVFGVILVITKNLFPAKVAR